LLHRRVKVLADAQQSLRGSAETGDDAVLDQVERRRPDGRLGVLSEIENAVLCLRPALTRWIDAILPLPHADRNAAGPCVDGPAEHLGNPVDRGDCAVRAVACGLLVFPAVAAVARDRERIAA